MECYNLRLTRMVVHEVKQRTPDGLVPPNLGDTLEKLDRAADTTFRNRVTEAFGAGGKSVEMACTNTGSGSAFELTGKLLASSNSEFIKISEEAATKLTDAQTRTQIPGGLLIVFSGTVQNPGRPFIGYLKAEPQDGFHRTTKDGREKLEFLKKLFLTRESKVYKIGMFVEMPSKNGSDPEYEYFLYDKNITKKQTSQAAAYFYQGFLGLSHLKKVAKLTHDFVVRTRQFISRLPLPEEKKFDLRSALISYVKTSQNATICPSEFANDYFVDEDTRDNYEAFCQKHEIPVTAFAKDLSECKKLFEKRTIHFRKGLTLSGPAETFGDVVEVEPYTPEGSDENWTRITVKADMKSGN
ncbi:hypothetical protein GM415_15990 [Pseudodesulfovibrio cashew]|uniref:Nucleoid-associated protein n=1 Tax=Pseudodesulfovibrio cashew TaxID=2678688 RepID=A0A6I6JN47_9BACT|nr:nucleoid-associated protein [Pseudodesulfovibrio cashew]QGY41557.1 hypothetical protein GM415_15990 [Pseudodesulfovibrio cashew]